MRKLVFILLLPLSLLAQVTYTPPVPPTAAKPATLTVTSGSATSSQVKCTITGDAVPAVNISVSCSLGPVTIPSFNIPFTSSGTAYTFQYNFNGQALTVIINGMTLPVNVTAAVNGAAAIGGAF